MCSSIALGPLGKTCPYVPGSTLAMAGRAVALALLLAAVPALAAKEIPTNYAFALQWGGRLRHRPQQAGQPHGHRGVPRPHKGVCVRHQQRTGRRLLARHRRLPHILWQRRQRPRPVCCPRQCRGLPQDRAIYATDPLNSRVVCYDESGVFIRNFGEASTGPGQFDSVVDVGVDDNGNVYVLSNTRMQKFSG